MPEQDNWKEEFLNKIGIYVEDGGFIVEDSDGKNILDTVVMFDFISSILSSQANALKEQISDIHQLLHNGHFEEAYKLTSKVLSAIESIEI